ncbi:MAG: alpha/beta fold hydrolase [Candidatus Pacebacteria bacterium]|nr:alpha/beta fold hydrolase [Candidatus Paceibacterota bacterium]
MKNALVLHGTSGNSHENWFPWLEKELQSRGYKVWTPDLPGAEKPNIQRYNDFIFSNKDWIFDGDSIIVGHSSGAVAILGLLQALPKDVVVNACYLVGSFRNDLEWDALKELFVEPFNFDLIKQKSRLFYFLHSDNDPYCPLSQAEYLHAKIGGDLIVLQGQKHFSVGTFGEAYRQFPYLLHLIIGDSMTQDCVIDLYTQIENNGIKIWLDGGWSVDALLEKQTRPHGDVDIVAQEKDVPALLKLLEKKGYHRVKRGDETDWNFIVGDSEARFVDFHIINLDKQGNGIYGPAEKGQMYYAEALTGKGKIGNLEIHCISPEWMVKFHTGYKLRAQDYLDVTQLCKKFGLELPEEYCNE